MADDRIREQIITKFFLQTCQPRQGLSDSDVDVLNCCDVMVRTENEVEAGFVLIPLLSGSVSEFYIEPMLTCIGDADIMFHSSNQLAIPEGYTPPAQLPGEFDSCVGVFEIFNAEFPGYVYLVKSYLLTACIDDDNYKAVRCQRTIVGGYRDEVSVPTHGPALLEYTTFTSLSLTPCHRTGKYFTQSTRSMDFVYCVRCLIWPPQAADWPTRQRNCGWPDSATVDHVVSNGCDVVQVAHPQCRQDKWMNKYQWMSFSRAEIVLLSSWMPVQQIVYHMLRIFMKTEKLIDSTANDSVSGTLSNYHIKTLMLWVCELKSRSWWTDDLNLVRICVKLLHTLAVWPTEARCKHYFINNCNLFDQCENSQLFTEVIANRLMSVTREWFCDWCIDNYICKCIQLCPRSVWTWAPPSRRLHDVFYLHNVVSAIVKFRHDESPLLTSFRCLAAQTTIMALVSLWSFTLRSYFRWINQLVALKSDKVLRLYFTAVVFLHVACKTTQGPLTCLLYTSPSPRDRTRSRMPSSA